jgi:hypothetical protein
MPKFRATTTPSRGEVARLALVGLYAIATFFVSGISRTFLLTAGAVYGAGALWGVFRFIALRTSPVRYVAPAIWGLITCRLLAPQSMRFVLIPRANFPTSFSEAVAQFAADVSTSGSLNLSVPVRGVVLAVVLAAGAMAAADTLVHRTLYRPLLFPVIVAALLSYRDGVGSPAAAVVALALAAVLFYMDGEHSRAHGVGDRRRELPAALVSGCVILFVAHTAGATAVYRFFADPVKQEVQRRLDRQDPRTVSRVSFSSMEDANRWVQQHMSEAQPTPGNVSDVLAAGTGSPAQLEAVAASLASAGGVDVEIRSDGSQKYSLPKPGESVVELLPKDETGAEPTPTEVTEPSTNSKSDSSTASNPETASSTPGTDQAASTATDIPSTTPSEPTTTSITGTPAPSLVAQNEETPSENRSVAAGFGMLLTTLVGVALLWRKRAQRLAASRTDRVRVLAAWHAADRYVAKMTRTSRDDSETFRERSRAAAELGENTEETFKALAELADQAAFSHIDPDPTKAEELSASITGAQRQHR